MANAPSIWNARMVEHQELFARLLKPAVRASASTLFDDDGVGLEVLQAWIMQLHDVPEDVLFEGFATVFSAGITWMPKPGEVRKACATVINDRRKAAAREAQALVAACEDCGGTTFRFVVDEAGRERVARCDCHRLALQIVDRHPQPLALPPARDEVTTP